MKTTCLIILGLLLVACSPLHNARKHIVKLINPLVGTCTGFEVVAPSGKVYTETAGHCVVLADSTGSILVETDDSRPIPRKIIEVDSAHDIMLLEGLPGVTEGLHHATSEPKKHSILAKLGHGLGLATFLLTGEYLGNYPFNLEKIVEVIIMPVQPGDSGSPILDADCNVVGIVSMGNGFLCLGVSLADINKFLTPY